MALFSRRPKNSDDEPSRPDRDEVTDAASADGASADVAEPDATADPAASVGISMSSYRGLGAAGSAEKPAAAPPAPAVRGEESVSASAETMPGLRDNILLRESLKRMPDQPQPQDLLELARQLLQGHLYLRVKGDARALIAEGKGLPLAVATMGDKKYALAYSSGAALTASVRADGDADTSAVAQSTMSVLRHVLAGDTEGLVLDPASAPARAVIPRALIERMLQSADENLAIKTVLAAPRTEATAAAVVDALTRAPMWVAVNRADENSPFGVAQGRAEDGSRYLEVFSHPLEVAAMRREDRSAPITAAQLAATLAGDEGLTGVLVDPRGPWIRLSRGELAPVLALGE
ncbi:SseB family protein [Microbacterium koreense]|uniref:SseB family protein n=1 Tax=Microbacterium koreense TaxID=323761 RepID=A0ABW2ZV96_9MICO